MSSHFPHVPLVPTPLGLADEVWATSDTHIGVRGVFEVNRCPYRVRLDLHFRDGKWQRGYNDKWETAWHSRMIDRDDSYADGKGKIETSSSARKKVENALVPWLVEYATGDGAEIVSAAGVTSHEKKIEAAKAAIVKLSEEIATAEAELASLTQ